MDNRNSIVNIVIVKCSTSDACFWDIMIELTSIDLSPFLEFNKETNPSKIFLVLPIFIVFHSFSKLHDSITLQTLKCIGELTNFQYNISS